MFPGVPAFHTTCVLLTQLILACTRVTKARRVGPTQVHAATLERAFNRPQRRWTCHVRHKFAASPKSNLFGLKRVLNCEQQDIEQAESALAPAGGRETARRSSWGERGVAREHPERQGEGSFEKQRKHHQLRDHLPPALAAAGEDNFLGSARRNFNIHSNALGFSNKEGGTPCVGLRHSPVDTSRSGHNTNCELCPWPLYPLLPSSLLPLLEIVLRRRIK